VSHLRGEDNLLGLRPVSRARQREVSALSKSGVHVGGSHSGPNPPAPPLLLPRLLVWRRTAASAKDTLYLIGLSFVLCSR
jgi:hypothetical protein